jgi:drug/metabolite transporter (DMT)-like permease
VEFKRDSRFTRVSAGRAGADALRSRAVLAAFLATLLFTISVTCGHRTAKLIGGVEANFWRLALATLFLGLWAYTGGGGLRGDAFPLFLLSGLIGIGVGDAGLFQALPRLGSRLSLLLIQCLTAPIAALVEWFWLGTTLGAPQVLCMALILGGVGVALSPGERLHLPRRAVTAGVGFALVGALGNGCGAVLSRRAYALAGASGQSLDGGTAAFQRILGGLLVAAILLLIAKRQFVRLPEDVGDAFDTTSAREKWRRIWPWVTLNSLAGQTLGVSAMQWALETTPTGIVMSIIALTPLTVIPFARMFENETITRRSLAGGVLAVLGVIGLTWARFTARAAN